MGVGAGRSRTDRAVPMSEPKTPTEENTVSLIPCPECAHEVSDRAPSCPQCGVPIFRESKVVVHGYNPAVPRQPQDQGVLERSGSRVSEEGRGAHS
jgi:hypothetical protein